MLIATLLFLYGEPVQDFIEHDLNRFMGIGTLALIAVLVLIKWGKPALAKLIIKTDPISKLKKLFSRYR